MGRAPCCEKTGLKKGPWTPEEDLKLTQYIQTHGAGNWRSLPKNAGLQRCGKSCRLRWTNYLRPDIKRGRFSFEEEETIIQLHSTLGNKWSAIAAQLPGRTDNEIKNFWNTHIRRRFVQMGIDPVTHSPRLDLLNLSAILTSSLCNPQLLNASNLLASQQFLNPELLKLATAISALNNVNLHENLLSNLQLPPLEQHFLVQQIPTFDNLTTFSTQFSQENQENFVTPSSNVTNPTVPGNLNEFGLNSGLSSPVSTPTPTPTPIDSSSTLVNSSEEESFCSNLLRWESFDIEKFLEI